MTFPRSFDGIDALEPNYWFSGEVSYAEDFNRAYHFAFEDIQNATIRLQGEIEPEHESHIVTALSDAGYTLTTSLGE